MPVVLAYHLLSCYPDDSQPAHLWAFAHHIRSLWLLGWPQPKWTTFGDGLQQLFHLVLHQQWHRVQLLAAGGQSMAVRQCISVMGWKLGFFPQKTSLMLIAFRMENIFQSCSSVLYGRAWHLFVSNIVSLLDLLPRIRLVLPI